MAEPELVRVPAPGIQYSRHLARTEFHNLLKDFLPTQGILSSEATDDEIDEWIYQEKHIVEFAVFYIFVLASESAANNSVISKRIKPKTLDRKVAALWWTVESRLGREASGVYAKWKDCTRAAVVKTAFGNDLGDVQPPRIKFGVPEYRLLFSHIMTKTRAISWWKQNAVAWAMSLAIGCRPRSLAVSSSYANTDQYLKWRDIQFFRREDGKPGLYLVINVRWIMGQRDAFHQRSPDFVPARFLLRPCRSTTNLPLDLTWMLPSLAIERGLFGNRTMRDLERSDEVELGQDSLIRDEPVFLKSTQGTDAKLVTGSPLLATAFNGPLRRLTQEVGLAVCVSMSVWRREFIVAIGRKLGKVKAVELAAEEPIDSNGRYDFGFHDTDMNSLLSGEMEISDMAEQHTLAKVLLARPYYQHRPEFHMDERNAFVQAKMSETEEVTAFNDALFTTINLLYDKFPGSDTRPRTRIAVCQRHLEQLVPLEGRTKYSFSPDNDSWDPQSWVIAAGPISVGEANSFFRQFLLARKSFRQSAIDKFAREWDDEWRAIAQSTIASKADIERYHKELQLPMSSLPAAKGVGITDEKLAETELVIEDAEDEDEHWAREIEDRLNPDRTVADLADQKPIEIEPEDEHYIPEEADRYRAERAFLIDWWTTTQDTDHGAMLCRQCIPKGNLDKPASYSLSSAFEFSHHIMGPICVHSETNAMTQYINSFGIEADFDCRMCDQILKSKDTFRDHLKSKHKDFIDRLVGVA